MKRILIFFIVASFFIIPAYANESTSLKGKVIKIAEDGSEWAPYTYYKRIDGKPSNEVIGYSVDVINEIFNKYGIKSSIKLLPWKRTLTEVEKGTNYQMFLSATLNEERNEKYYVSIPYYTTSGYYFYSKKIYPKGLPIKTLADLKKYKVAGLLGHNYTNYGFKDNELFTGANTYSGLAKQLQSKRYDIFLESYEILVGYSKINENILANKDLGYAKVPGMKSVDFHMMFTKNEIGKELKRIIDEELVNMKKNGRLEKIMNKYIPKN